jgi:hypothetical protein
MTLPRIHHPVLVKPPSLGTVVVNGTNLGVLTRCPLSGSLFHPLPDECIDAPFAAYLADHAFMENEHWPCALANDEVTLPMAALGSGVDLLGPFVDGDAILDGISRRSRPARAAAFVTAREITP